MPDDQCARHLMESRDLLEKIVETHTDVKHILKTLESGKETFKDHENRIRKVEQEYQFEKGKIAIIVLLLGAAVTLMINFLMWLYSKLK